MNLWLIPISFNAEQRQVQSKTTLNSSSARHCCHHQRVLSFKAISFKSKSWRIFIKGQTNDRNRVCIITFRSVSPGQEVFGSLVGNKIRAHPLHIEHIIIPSSLFSPGQWVSTRESRAWWRTSSGHRYYILVFYIYVFCFRRYYELCSKKVIYSIPSWNYTIFSFVCIEGENVEIPIKSIQRTRCWFEFGRFSFFRFLVWTFNRRDRPISVTRPRVMMSMMVAPTLKSIFDLINSMVIDHC